MAFVAADLHARVRQLLPELLKFGIVGGIGTVVDLGGAAVLHGTYHVEPLAAKAASTTAATAITYLGSRFWTFRDRENQELKREAVLFIALNLVGLLIAEVVVGFVTYIMSMHGQIAYNVASFLGTGFGTIFRYFAYKKWVFLAPGEDLAAAPASPAPRSFPDYPPWELDPAFLAATVPAPAVVPVTASASAPAPSAREPEPDVAWDAALATTMSWNALMPRTAPLPQTPADRAPDYPPQDYPPPGLNAPGFPPPGFAPQDYPPPGFPASDVPPPGLNAPGFPPPDYPPSARSTVTRSPGGGRHRKS